MVGEPLVHLLQCLQSICLIAATRPNKNLAKSNSVLRPPVEAQDLHSFSFLQELLPVPTLAETVDQDPKMPAIVFDLVVIVLDQISQDVFQPRCYQESKEAEGAFTGGLEEEMQKFEHQSFVLHLTNRHILHQFGRIVLHQVAPYLLHRLQNSPLVGNQGRYLSVDCQAQQPEGRVDDLERKETQKGHRFFYQDLRNNCGTVGEADVELGREEVDDSGQHFVREVSIEIVLDGVSDYIDDVGLVFFRKLRGRETIKISERISKCGQISVEDSQHEGVRNFNQFFNPLHDVLYSFGVVVGGELLTNEVANHPPHFFGLFVDPPKLQVVVSLFQEVANDGEERFVQHLRIRQQVRYECYARDYIIHALFGFAFES